MVTDSRRCQWRGHSVPREYFRQENRRNRSRCDWDDDVHVVNVVTGLMWRAVRTPPLQSQLLLFLLFSCQKKHQAFSELSCSSCSPVKKSLIELMRGSESPRHYRHSA